MSAAIEEIAAADCERGSPDTDRKRASRIAIIDHGVLTQDLFKHGLELASGFEVLTAATVEEWLDATIGAPVALVILCLREGQSITDVRDRMHALDIRQDSPVAILADRELIDAERVTWLLEQGAHGFISTEMPLKAAVHVLRMVCAAER